MLDLSTYCGATYVKPFTVKDTANNTWSIATDRVWFMAIQQEGPFSRLRADISLLNWVMKVLKAPPNKGVSYSKKRSLSLLEESEEHYVKTLGVVLDSDRLHKVMADFGDEGVLWDATELMGGVPTIGLLSMNSRCFLAGVVEADSFTEISFENPLDDFLY